MYSRIKNWVATMPGLGLQADGLRAVAAWAASHGLAYAQLPGRGDFVLSASTQGVPWRLERTHAGRDFITGAELRARAELQLPPELAIMLLNRPLKEQLEKRVYEHVTQGVQTTVDADLSEEARWLALYDQVGWSAAPTAFWGRYAVVADTREHAQRWLDADLVQQLLAWPVEAAQMPPFILQIQRGRVYLRMEYPRHALPMLEHAVAVLAQACISAQALVV
jgi:hypothetical protein